MGDETTPAENQGDVQPSAESLGEDAKPTLEEEAEAARKKHDERRVGIGVDEDKTDEEEVPQLAEGSPENPEVDNG